MKNWEIGTWVCDKCYSEMEATHEGKNRNRIYCPNCGTEWYVDDDEEYIMTNMLMKMTMKTKI